MIKRRLLRLALLVSLVSFGLQACFEDKGNYDYHDINELTIGGIEEEYEVRRGELVITPTIAGTLENATGDDYSYEWVRLRGSSSTNTNYAVVAQTRDLNYTINLTAGLHRFCFRVKDERTGVQWSSEVFEVQVQNPMGAGILMMSDENNETALYYSNYYQGEIWDPMAVDLSSLPSLGKPIQVVCYPDLNSPVITSSASDGRYAVVLLTEKRALRLRVTDLNYSSRYNLKNLILYEEPSGFGVTALCPTTLKEEGECILRDNNGNYMLYSRSGNTAILWTHGTYINTDVQYGTPFNASDKIAYDSQYNGAIIFNEDTKSFGRLSSKGSFVTYFEPVHEVHFKYNNTGRDLLYIKSRQQEGNTWGKFYAIMKDASDRIYMDTFTLVYQGNDSQIGEVELTSMTNIANAVQFEMTHGNVNNNFIFYRTDKEIYAYDISTHQSTKVFTAPGNNLISLMKTIEACPVGSESIPKGALDDRMMVFTYDPAAPAETCGQMQLFEAGYAPDQGVGRQIFAPVEIDGQAVVLTGFGKVVSADWKQK